MKKTLLRSLIALLALFQVFVVALYLRRDNTPLRSLVSVDEQTYYVLPIKGGDTLFFALASDSDLVSGVRDSVVLLRSLHTQRQAAQHTVTHSGYRVSRNGEVQVFFSPRPDTLQGKALQKLIVQSLEAERQREKLLHRRVDELHYYARTHSVTDEGYNEVMAYADEEQHRWENCKNVIERLERATTANRVLAQRKTRYTAGGKHYVVTERQKGLLRLAPATEGELAVGTGALQRGVLYPQVDTLHRQFVDEKRTFFSLTRHVNGWTGTALWANGDFYRGTFDSIYRRDGHGFAVNGRMVQSGTWRADHYRGERMIYTADRVYGIDISRHQHEIGKKIYPIHWPSLRIVGIGSVAHQHAAGKVDYPVSFVFIKATQGTTIFSKYYPYDLNGARSQGIPVAPYHFYSPRSSGIDQAKYFLKYARIPLTSMPPVLDVEPTDQQIAQMGGREVLFRETLNWMRYVERATGRRPILYVGQSFVNDHLPHAPEALRSYDVWIARYGEFRPYVKLAFWQLTPEGRVRGIHGDVDINVFNGNQEEFARWRKQ